MSRLPRTVLLALLLPGWASAEPVEETPPVRRGPPEGISVGVMYTYRGPLYVGEDNDHIAYPAFAIRQNGFYWYGPIAGYEGFQKGPWSGGPHFRARWQDFENDSHPLLEGLDEPDLTLEGGARLRLRLSPFTWENELMHDLLDAHGGASARSTLGLGFPPFKGVRPHLAVGLDWRSATMNDYYVGVPADRARADRPAYRPGDSWQPLVEASLVYALTEKWTVRASVTHEWLDDAVTDSPIISEDTDFRLSLGITRRL